jgi:rhodanese-related sulfurtransferase
VTRPPTTATDIDVDTARRLVEDGAFLLDVREDDEWVAGHAPDAVHIAMGLVPDQVDRLPDDQTVVCVCRVGGRSGVVAQALAAAGYEVRNLDGGMLAWESAGLAVVTPGGDAGRII